MTHGSLPLEIHPHHTNIINPTKNNNPSFYANITTIMKKPQLLPQFVIPAIFAVITAHAAGELITIYEDDFSGTPGASLKGTNPDIRPAAETWQFNNATALDGFTADGTVVNTGGGVDGQISALLPFSPVAGKIYRLTASVAATESTSWIGLGFADTLTTADNTSGLFAFSSLQGISWILAAGPGSSGNQFFAGPQNTNLVLGTFTSGVQNYEIVLDTGGSQWKTSFFRGGIQQGETFTYPVNPTIAGVGFTKNEGVGGTVDNFKLTAEDAVVIPEPPWVTVYEDDFNGDAAASLNGSAPDVRPNEETWSFQNSTALDGFKADGTAVATDGGALGQVAALLPFTPEPGRRYRLTGTMNATATGQWLALGFADRLTTADGESGLFAFSPLNGIAWAFQAGPGAHGSQAFAGPDITDVIFNNFNIGESTWLIELNTSAEQWTVNFFRGGVQRGTTHTYLSNPTILGVGFSKGHLVPGYIDNFKLEYQDIGVVLSGFKGWAADNGIEGEPFDEDFDLDGTSNGMEYALGMLPAVPDVIDPAPLVVTGNTLTVTYLKGADAAADEKIRYAIEVSSDLGDDDPWQEIVATYEDISEITYEMPQSSTPSFARLKVVQNQ
ncbi:MAG: hypothetical protein WEB53_15365 [Akkermansiaceae bacterium]